MADIPLIIPGSQGHFPKNAYYVHNYGGNGYPVISGIGGLVSYLPLPNLVYDISALPPHPVRAMRVVKDNLYSLVGNTLYKTDASGSYTNLGTVTTYTGRAKMIDNGTDIMLCVFGVNAYNITISTGAMAIISDADLPPLSSLDYQDGYALGVQTNSEAWWICAYLDFTDWNALDFEYANRLPDQLMCGKVIGGEFWALGKYTGEVFRNTGATFPWEKFGGVDLDIGTLAPDGPEVVSNQLYFPDNNNQVRRTVGYQTEIISTEALEDTLSRLTAPQDAQGFGIKYLSNWWYVLNYPTDKRTFIYDITASARLEGPVWYRWTSFPDNDRCRINCYAYFNRKHLIGDYQTGIIWELTPDTYTENGYPNPFELTLPKVPDGGKRMTWKNFQLDMLMGVGTVSGDGDDPQVMTSYSDDDGRTFINESLIPMGKIGENTRRARRTQLGQSKGHGRIMRARITDPVERIIKEARINI